MPKTKKKLSKKKLKKTLINPPLKDIVINKIIKLLSGKLKNDKNINKLIKNSDKVEFVKKKINNINNKNKSKLLFINTQIYCSNHKNNTSYKSIGYVIFKILSDNLNDISKYKTEMFLSSNYET